MARADAGHFGNVLSALRSAGLIEDAGSGAVVVTSAGQREASWDLGDDLVAEWSKKLSGLEREILAQLVAHYPAGLTRAQLGDLTGKRADAGHFGNCLSALRGNGVAVQIGSELFASKELFS